MEEEKLKIVEMKKCRKTVNKAFSSKCLDVFFAVVSSWSTCYNLHEFIENGKMKNLVFVFIMLNSYIFWLKESRNKNEIINENLNKKIELEEQAIKEGLVK